MKTQLSVLAFLTVGLLVTPVASEAQLVQRYASDEKQTVAADTAKATLGDSARLAAIATTGELDFSDAGFPLTVDGFRADDGESAAWAYLYKSPSGDSAIGVAVIQFAIGGDLTYVEAGDPYDVGTRELDLSGEHATSTKFAERLRQNSTFTQYGQDYPDAIPESVVFAWRPWGVEFLPAEFPADKPIWGIYFGTNVEQESDSTMVCFVSSGGGETYCLRFESSGVSETVATAREADATASPNPVSGVAALSVEYDREMGAIGNVVVFDLNGREIVSLADVENSSSGTGRRTARFAMDGLAPGRYVLQLECSSGSFAVPVQVR